MKKHLINFVITILLITSLILYINTTDYKMTSILMVTVLTLILTILTIYEDTRIYIIYAFVLLNNAFLTIVLIYSDSISYLYDYSYNLYYAKTILFETFFWVSFAVFLSYFKKNKDKIYINNNTQLIVPHKWFGYLAILLLIIELILNNKYYYLVYSEKSDTGTVLYEFSCVIFSIFVLNKKDNRFYIIELLCLFIIFYIMLGSGKRLPLSYVVIAYSLYYTKIIGRKNIFYLLSLFFMFSFLLGIFRESFTLENFDAEKIYHNLSMTNQGAVLHAAASYIRIADEGLIDITNRLLSFFYNYIGALFLPLSLLPIEAQPNIYAGDYYPVQGNGGLIGGYSYFFLGWIGAPIMAYAYSYLLTRKTKILGLLSLTLIVTSPRWTLYNIGPSIRLISLLLIVLFFFYFIKKLSSSKNIRF